MLMTVSGPAPTVAAISESLEGKDDGMVYKVAPCEPEDLVEEQEEFAAFFRLEGGEGGWGQGARKGNKRRNKSCRSVSSKH
jgi:hypothetical protein